MSLVQNPSACAAPSADAPQPITLVRPARAAEPAADARWSVGLVQVEELGVLETPIALTNTFAVGAVAQAQIRQAIAANPETGRSLSTVNPLVFECNDGYLNDIQALAIEDAHYRAACAVCLPLPARTTLPACPMRTARS